MLCSSLSISTFSLVAVVTITDRHSHGFCYSLTPRAKRSLPNRWLDASIRMRRKVVHTLGGASRHSKEHNANHRISTRVTEPILFEIRPIRHVTASRSRKCSLPGKKKRDNDREQGRSGKGSQPHHSPRNAFEQNNPSAATRPECQHYEQHMEAPGRRHGTRHWLPTAFCTGLRVTRAKNSSLVVDACQHS